MTSPLVTRRRNTPLDSGAPHKGAVDRRGGVDQTAARDQRRHPFHHIIDLGGGHRVEVGAALNVQRAEHSVDPDTVFTGNLHDANRTVACPVYCAATGGAMRTTHNATVEKTTLSMTTLGKTTLSMMAPWSEG